MYYNKRKVEKGNLCKETERQNDREIGGELEKEGMRERD